MIQKMTSSKIVGHTLFLPENPYLDISGTGSRLVMKTPQFDSHLNSDSEIFVIKIVGSTLFLPESPYQDISGTGSRLVIKIPQFDSH
jgi:hypothetical protein